MKGGNSVLIAVGCICLAIRRKARHWAPRPAPVTITIPRARRLARFLTAMTMDITALAKACGKSSAHDLEGGPLRDLSFQASAFTGVKVAGIGRAYQW